ncbi:phage minor tail protein L [Caballeronia cordobensis]|uniref:phage minor tail protein L n=1 Tax=Caballeronia cordobensis TaxID=1353886 RepID=UPI00045EE03A|nr:phage minor tail protein L [Burkholderia sp. RPE67]
MSVKGDIQGLHPSAEIELFVIDLRPYRAQSLYFHAGTNKLGGDVIWQGQTYVRYPVSATGFEWKSQGTTPRPHFAVSNVTGIIGALCRQYSDLVGCKVTRKRTLARYLDAANFPDGNPFANPDESFEDDVFAVNQKTRESGDVIEFELAPPFDVEGVMVPRRQVITNSCPWRYRGDGCGYAGPPVADIHDNPTSDANLDACGKRLQSCRMRFGNGWLPFGGFPGAGVYRR